MVIYRGGWFLTETGVMYSGFTVVMCSGSVTRTCTTGWQLFYAPLPLFLLPPWQLGSFWLALSFFPRQAQWSVAFVYVRLVAGTGSIRRMRRCQGGRTQRPSWQPCQRFLCNKLSIQSSGLFGRLSIPLATNRNPPPTAPEAIPVNSPPLAHGIWATLRKSSFFIVDTASDIFTGLPAALLLACSRSLSAGFRGSDHTCSVFWLVFCAPSGASAFLLLEFEDIVALTT